MTTTKTRAADTGTHTLIPYKQIKLGDNVRVDLTDIDDLAESIAEHGLLSPLRLDDASTIVFGHRRHAALGKLIADKRWIGEVPVFIGAISDEDRIVTQLIENLQRIDLNPVDEAIGFQRLALEYGYDADKIAGHVRRPVSFVKDRIALCNLPDKILALVRDGKITLIAATTLAKAPAAVIEKFEKRGGIFSEFGVQDAVSKHRQAEKMKPIKKALADLDIKIAKDSYSQPKGLFTTKQIAVEGKWKDALDKLPKTPAKEATINTYGTVWSITVRWPMSDADKAKLEEQTAKVADASNAAELNAQLQARAMFEKEISVLDDALKAWAMQCYDQSDQIDENERTYNKAREEARMAWAVTLSAKDLAAQLLRTAAVQLARLLQFNQDYNRARNEQMMAALAIPEKDQVLLDGGKVDWTATILAKSAYITKAAALSTMVYNRDGLPDGLDAYLAENGVVAPVMTFPAPPDGTFAGWAEDEIPEADADGIDWDYVDGVIAAATFKAGAPRTYEDEDGEDGDDE